MGLLRVLTIIASSILIAAVTPSLVRADLPTWDFNGDGDWDYVQSLIGHDTVEPVTGTVFVWSGATGGLLHEIDAPVTNDYFGWCVGSAGDVDGDGSEDVLVSAPLYGGDFSGAVYIFSGADASILLVAAGPHEDAALGRYVIGVGDWDADGTPDIAASGWRPVDDDADGVYEHMTGVVWIISGFDASVLAELRPADPSDRSFGRRLAAVGDINGDGHADIAVMAPEAPGIGAWGQVAIFTGRAAGPVPPTIHDSEASHILYNDNPSLRVFAAQVDPVDPGQWTSGPLLQVSSLITGYVGGVTDAPSVTDVVDLDGFAAGTKGVRNSLTLVGDVNLDTQVGVEDIQEVIGQIGLPASPAVMPTADIAQDGVVDVDDAVYVIGEFGGSTDILQGLDQPGRLANVIVGNVTGSLSTGRPVKPGIGPIGNCLASTDLGGTPNPGGSPIPGLLGLEAGENCNECPDFEDDPSCYVCGKAGTLSGGTITADNSQPKPGECVQFTIEQVVLSGKELKCTAECGGQKKHTLGDKNIGHSWVLFEKDASGAWVPFLNGGGDPPPVCRSACAEIKIEVRAFVAEDGDCAEQELMVEKEVQFADFRYEVLCYADDSERTTIGVNEYMKISLDPPGATASWVLLSGSGSITVRDGGQRADFRAPMIAGSSTIEMVSGGCARRVNFTIKAPNEIIMHRVAGDFHDSNEASAGFKWCIQVAPLDVSFRYIWIREGLGTAVGTGGLAIFNGFQHSPWNTQLGCDNFAKDVDGAYSGGVPPNGNGGFLPGTFRWDIPWEWKRTSSSGVSGTIIQTMNVRSTLTANGTMTHGKGNIAVTYPFGPPHIGLPWFGEICDMFHEPANDVTPCP